MLTRYVLSALIILLLGACTYEHTMEFSQKWAGRIYAAEYFDIQRNGSERIPGAAKIYIPFPVTILGPKADVPQMEYLCDALHTRFPEAYCALRPESHEESMKIAESRGDDFLINAEVAHWSDKKKPNQSEEDEKTNDSYLYNNVGVDSIEINMSIHYVRSGKLFDVVRLKARSPVIAGFANQPVELLRCAYQDLVAALATEKIL